MCDQHHHVSHLHNMHHVGTQHHVHDLQGAARCRACRSAHSHQVSRIFDTEATVVFGIIMSMWGSFFVDFWKRRQAFVRVFQ